MPVAADRAARRIRTQHTSLEPSHLGDRATHAKRLTHRPNYGVRPRPALPVFMRRGHTGSRTERGGGGGRAGRGRLAAQVSWHRVV